MKKYGDSIGRVYLYLFSMLGLVLVVIGTTGLINLGLKIWIFDVTDPWSAQPPAPYWSNRIDVLTSCDDLSEQDKVLMNQWLKEYESWEANSSARYKSYQNNESAARNLALLLVGIPLFLFHWGLVRKSKK
ncbi:hypothetical protein KO361_02950 [Candidatus Woesearchaeota archaeon]|nr:hypothetical protein [Candidatus Woesearchaeota archaeon]